MEARSHKTDRTQTHIHTCTFLWRAKKDGGDSKAFAFLPMLSVSVALGRWCRQLAVYCLDVAVITVASLVRLTSIAAVAYGSYRDIAYLNWLKGGLWTCRSLSAYRAARHWTDPRLEQEKATASPRCHDGVTCGSHSPHSARRTINMYILESPAG